jgi:hypothetical protein
LVRRSLVEAVGRFDTSLAKSADWDLWQRIARTGAEFGAVRDVLAFYRIRPNAASQEGLPLFLDGMRVLRQGHSPDPRVPNPDPLHARGEAPELVRTQEFYLLCWCAGLMLGRGEDARRLLALVPGDDYPELDAKAVAQCIYESAPLPSGQSPASWESLWPRVERGLEELLTALERHTGAPELQRKATHELKRLILKSNPTWRLVIEEFEEGWKRQTALAEDFRRRIVALEEQLDRAVRGAAVAEDLRRRVAELDEELAQARRCSDPVREKSPDARQVEQVEQEMLRQQALVAALVGRVDRLGQSWEAWQELSDRQQTLIEALAARVDRLDQNRKAWQELSYRLESVLSEQRAYVDALALQLRKLESSFWIRAGKRLGFVGARTPDSEKRG